MRHLLAAAAICLVSLPVAARSVSGVDLPERVRARDDTEPVLNGAGVRTKFFFDIYVGALYLPAAGQELERIRQTDQPARVDMHFEYSEVSHDKLADAWREGFRANNAPEVYDRVEDRLARFVDLFPTAHENDVYVIDYLPGHGTEVRINGEPVGTIAGAEFFHALLNVWLGPDPADDDLKDGMLGRR